MASEGVSNTDEYTVITNVQQIDFNDEAAVMHEVNNFAEVHAFANVENALVITPLSKIYSLRGNEVAVNPSIISHDELLGSIVIHNHPANPLTGMGDSFSRADLIFVAEHGLGKQYLVSGTRRNSFEFVSPHTSDAVYAAWERAENLMLERAMSNGVEIIHWQAEILEVLAEITEGVVFYDRF